MTERARGWCFTLNNYTEDEVNRFDTLKDMASYLIYGKEVGAKGTPHLQGYIYFSDAKSFTKVKKLLPTRCHIEKARGSPQEATDYCKKDGEYVEYGEVKQQGKRVDLISVKDSIVSGTDVENILMENPVIYHQYGRTLDKIQDVVNRRKTRTEFTRGIWVYGASGCGKSDMVFKNYNPLTAYVWKKDKEWQDGYKQQPLVIIDEFRGQLPFYKLLELADKHTNCWVERRGKEAIPFTSKMVVITSSLQPEDVYKNLDANDKWIQFDRRYMVLDIADIKQRLVYELQLKFLEKNLY